jgi:hypothetical protein
MKWPPHSPSLTPYDCFCCGYVKEKVFYKSYLRIVVAEARGQFENLWESKRQTLEAVMGGLIKTHGLGVLGCAIVNADCIDSWTVNVICRCKL